MKFYGSILFIRIGQSSTGIAANQKHSLTSRKSNIKRQKPAKAQKIVPTQMKTTGEDGSVAFANVPIDNYIISVEDSKNYMGNSKSLNLINERVVQESFCLYVELKPQICSFLEVTIQDSDEGASPQ